MQAEIRSNSEDLIKEPVVPSQTLVPVLVGYWLINEFFGY